MKIMTILGTRPEIIRLSRVIPLLDGFADHVLVHTGQNFDDRLSGIFFEELGVRQPDEFMGVRASGPAGQIGQILEKTERLLLEHRPDRLLILGDTNSGMAAIIARRLGIPVYHMEAGNRCFDDRVPEEVNRRVIDHCSTVLLPYTHNSKENLLREGIPANRVFVTGNPIKQVLDHYASQIDASTILETLGLEGNRYFVVTAHRAENVDNEARLRSILAGLRGLHEEYGFPVVYSVHPRTRSKLEQFGLVGNQHGVRLLDPLGLVDFVRLEQQAFCLLSDSGTVQEEGCILGVPNVTIRDVTERPETVECGSNVLSGCEPDQVRTAVRLAVHTRGRWTPPVEYVAEHVAETVCRIVTSYRLPDLAEIEWQAQSRTTRSHANSAS
jgi:UDP-N-acetylglucosamine 2-epimerase (non-hydrolysing)